MPNAVPSPSHKQVDLILQSLDELPTLSPVAVRLLKVTGAHDADFDQIVKLIEVDPALSAKVLSLVRKAGVGAARAVTTVKRAAVMLGLEAIQSAVLSVQIYELLQQAPGGDERREHGLDAFDRTGFWKHSIAVACASEMLARERPATAVNPEEAFIAGLVHDLGKLALDWVLPKTYDRVVRQAQSAGRTLHSAERSSLGVDHHQAGKRLAERWSLPHQLQDAMWLHGQPPGAMPDLPHRTLVGVVAIANGLAHRMMIGWSGCGADGGGAGGGSAGALADAWSSELGFSPQILASVAERLHDAVAERCRLLGVGEETPASMVIESFTAANTRLARLHEQVRAQSRAATGASRALALITEFAGAERPGGTLSDTLSRIAQGWNRLTGRGPLAVICQTRTNSAEPWRFLRCDGSGNVVESLAIPAPVSTSGEPLDLRQLGGNSLGSAFEMAQWLGRRLGPGVPVSRLSTLTLASALGPAAVVVHEPVESTSVSPQALATITTIWAWAVGAAAQSEGSRRVAENLAQTARELSETQARLADAESMARLGEFTSGAAHEMNNPLTIISGRAQCLAEKLKDPKQRDDAAAIVKATDALTDLVTQLHVVASPPRPRTAPVPLKFWAQGVVAEARKRAGASVPAALAVRIDVPESDAPFDGPQIARATVELLVNAMQSQPRSGVVLKVRPDEPDPSAAGRQLLRVWVVDDGRGMSEYTRKHACDPFFSSLPAGRRPGLGLALAKRLIEASGGALHFDSKPDRGTTATFGIPSTPSEQVAPPPLIQAPLGPVGRAA
ncbi:MAG TPA: HDOD domain-containing protein [Phycisphaerales bacterium]|nr:HDOD domain-containing protein [Phycisphaerales bacterium]